MKRGAVYRCVYVSHNSIGFLTDYMIRTMRMRTRRMSACNGKVLRTLRRRHAGPITTISPLFLSRPWKLFLFRAFFFEGATFGATFWGDFLGLLLVDFLGLLFRLLFWLLLGRLLGATF